MHPDKWPETKDKIRNSFEVISEDRTEDEDRHESAEVIIFDSPMGRIKLEWLTRPKVLDTKTHYSNRIGGDVSTEVVYSEDEVTHTLKAYRWDDAGNDFVEINSDSFIL